jgi:hypothetical protein
MQEREPPPVHLDAEDFDDVSPSWPVIAGLTLFATVILPAFLAWCGSL